MALEDSLKQYFGFDSFRSGQKEVIESLLSGQDVLGILPTATGKSLCYQLPSYLTSGITIVVSPLISLMEDQVSQLNSKKIQAVALNSQLTAAEKEFVLWHLSCLLYTSPSPRDA